MSSGNFVSLNIDQMIERVKLKIGCQTDKELAAFLGLSSGDFSNRKKRGSLFPLLIQWAANERVDLNNLVWGWEKGPLMTKIREFDDELTGGAFDVYDLLNCTRPDYWYNNKADGQIILSDKYGNGKILLKMAGSSMEPTIHDGAIIGVNRESYRFNSGKIYVLWMPEEGPVVRRVFVNMENVTLKADNPQFPDIIIQAKDIPKKDFNLGHVDWVLQTL